MTWSSRGAGVFACSSITLFIAATTVVLRFISRGYLCRVLRSSDWVIAVALLFSISTTVTHGLLINHGLGKHIWENPRSEEMLMMKLGYITIILYHIGSTLTKLSILLLFTDIFHITVVRQISWCMIIIVSLYGVYMTMTNVFFCYPIPIYWTPDDQRTPGDGWCFNKERKWFADASINLVTDFVIWGLPLPVVRGMKRLGKRERVWLFGVFGVGFFICIVSIIRLYPLKLSATSSDPSYDNAPVTCWSAIELNVSIAIACLMTLKPLLARLLPRLVHDGIFQNHPPQNGNGNVGRDSPHDRRLKRRQRQMKGRNGNENGARLQKKKKTKKQRGMSERLGQAAEGAGRRMSGGVMSVMSVHGRHSQGFSRGNGGFAEMRDMDDTMKTDFSSQHPATISSPPLRRGKAGGRYGSGSASHYHRPMGRDEEEVLGMTGLSSLDGSRWLDEDESIDDGRRCGTLST
ncbi:hypothetical protein QBC32DRAFT_52249 [Pseudoneurospora amorphoporcata]|uniref:Rhodopsin domain-containing protein n=1 Tax=Pseudoneurospora amorphoporcata TaxID=241081 RepID=A0AAN6P095_9PEZI|nr:hypothetical protein QBC32DRAFT_52249 [Pseudoneurospora amorphoporcata]